MHELGQHSEAFIRSTLDFRACPSPLVLHFKKKKSESTGIARTNCALTNLAGTRARHVDTAISAAARYILYSHLSHFTHFYIYSSFSGHGDSDVDVFF